MKLAILTLPVNYNYGGIMQAYALQTVLSRLGNDVVVLDVPRQEDVSILIPIKRWVKKYIFHKPTSLSRAEKMNAEKSTIMQYTWQFIDKYIRTRVIRSFDEIKESDYDGYIVGSDQVWRPCYFKGDFGCGINQAYLAFARNWKVKRIGYAISLGSDNWEYTDEETERCSMLAQLFDAVSVREESAIDLLSKHVGVAPTMVLDPTLLLAANDYVTQLDIEKVPQSKGNLLCYLLDANDKANHVVEYLCNKNNYLVPFTVSGTPEDDSAPIENRVQPPVEQWIRGFYDADIVVTDSFHACVFSLIFGKPFYVIANEDRGLARIESLLKMLGLENRLIRRESDMEAVPDVYDVAQVLARIQQQRQDSIEYLKSNLAK